MKVLNDELVTYIADWSENNKIRADRKVDSRYKSLLLKLIPDVNLIEAKKRADTGKFTGQPMDVQTVSNGQPMDGIGKDSIGESIGASAPSSPHADKPTRKKYGQYGWVSLTDKEHDRLISELGEAEFNRCVDYIDERAQLTGNKNKWKDWNLVLRKCSKERWGPSLTEAEQRPSFHTEIIDGEEVAVRDR